MTIEIRPIPGSPQELFCRSSVREVGFGGEAGGAKSFGLVLDALYQIDKPGYNAILFRRTYKRLSGADGLIELSKQIYPSIGGQYSESKYLWTFNNYPGTIRFAHLEHDKNIYDHDGLQYAYIGMDELQQFTERAYLYLFSRNRSSNPDINPFTRTTFMPGDIGHFWVKKRFITRGVTGHVRRFKRVDGIDTEVDADDHLGIDRLFLPAKLEDNPYLYQDGKGDYEKALHQLDTVDYRRKRGDWDIRRAGRVYHAFTEANIAPASHNLDLSKASFYHGHDFGAVNRVWGLYARIDDKYYLVHEEILPEGTTAKRAAKIKAHLKGRKVVAGWGGAGSEKQQRRDYRAEGVAIRKPPMSKAGGVMSQIDKVNKMFEAGTLMICSDMTLTTDQLENCIFDEKEDIQDKSQWHFLDQLRYFGAGISKGGGWSR